MLIHRNFWKNRLILFLVLISLVIHIMLAFLPGQVFDINYWVEWSSKITQVGFDNFYSVVKDADYPPGYLYILYGLGVISHLLNLSLSNMVILVKIPGILAEIVLGVLVYEILKHKSIKSAQLAASCILFNPALIFDSAIWGQVDSLLTLLLVLSIYLQTKHKTIHSSVSFSLGILTKPQALALTPVFLLNFLKDHSFKKFLSLILPGLILLFWLSLPFFPHNSLVGLIQKITSTTNEYPLTSLSALNIWRMIGDWQSDQAKIFIFTYQVWGILLYLLYSTIITYFYIKKKLSIFALSALFLLGFYFLMTRIHERYLYPALVFLIIVIFQTRNKVILVLTGLLHVLFLLDLIYVYFKYNGIPSILNSTVQPLYNFLDLHAKLIAAAAAAIFIVLSYSLLRQDYEVIA